MPAEPRHSEAAFETVIEDYDEGLQQAAAVNPEDQFELVSKNLLDRLFVERMDQNEEVFVRFMNDEPFQRIVTTWMATEAYRRLRRTVPLPFALRPVSVPAGERYVTCVPLVPLKAAAGSFGDLQHIEDGGWQWVAVDSRHRLRPGMFVAQVVGKSMEPAIPDGFYCLFAAPVTGTRQGKTVLVQLRDAADPETGERYTVKRYESEKAGTDDSWRHRKIILKPVNPDFAPIVLNGVDDGNVRVIAEVVEVLGAPA